MFVPMWLLVILIVSAGLAISAFGILFYVANSVPMFRR